MRPRLGANARADASSAVDDDATGRRRASPASSSSARIAMCAAVSRIIHRHRSTRVSERASRSDARVRVDARLRVERRARTTREALVARDFVDGFMTRAHSCARCKRAAFDAESVDVDAETRYHAACFKCADCGARCAIATFVKIGEEVYCRRHALERDVRRKPALGADALEIATYANRRTTTAREWVKMETEGTATGRGTSATARATGGTAARATAALTRSACERCGKAAYPIESVDVDGKKWHRAGCFKCATCGVALSLTTFVKFDGELYCRRDAPKSAPSFERESSSAGIEIEIESAPVKAMSVADEIVVEKAAAVEERAAAEIAATADEIEIEASENEPPAVARDAKDALESLEPASNEDVEAITENIAATKIADDSATIPKPHTVAGGRGGGKKKNKKKSGGRK